MSWVYVVVLVVVVGAFVTVLAMALYEDADDD